ncbi:hypothetical protein ACWD4V_20230 [Streptomyces tsukubensis]|uniref:hypothetical protein n=1 Tax=Streptomyces tsukubensis TaxID=83656 RepID=UPI0036A7BB29
MAAAPEAFYPPIDDRQTAEALAGSGIHCSEATRELFGKHVEFFAEKGYFPAKRHARTDGADRPAGIASVGVGPAGDGG